MIATANLARTRSTRWILVALSLAVVVVFVFSLSIGQIHIAVSEIVSIFLRKAGLLEPVASVSVEETVLLSIRLPRLVMTVFIGASLGICGAALQGLFRNPLVEPGLIGVSSGSALAV